MILPTRLSPLHSLRAVWRRPSRRTCQQRRRLAACGGEATFDVYAMSDLHTDHEENLAWVEALPKERYRRDVLIVAGDVSERLPRLKATFEILLERFHKVAFVPGNHELWVIPRSAGQGLTDSLEKLDRVLKVCSNLGVLVRPTRIANLWLVPLMAWHHISFDEEPDLPEMTNSFLRKTSDYRLCRWPSLSPEHQEKGSTLLADYFDDLNVATPELDKEKCDIISFSHFVPRLDLIPEKRFLNVAFLAKIAGSKYLRQRVLTLQPQIHVFGHTHIAWDATLDGVRYVQYPLAYPKQRRSCPSSLVVASTEGDPRLGTNDWEPEWGGDAPDWLPVKIYTHASVDAGTPVSRTNTSNGVVEEKTTREDGPTLVAGTMSRHYAKWSEHYRNAERFV